MTEQIRLTEKQAWETLARFFEGVAKLPDDRARHRRGICYQARELVYADLVSWDVSDAVYRISDALPYEASGYAWPLTAKGAKKRAAFCWKQARG